MAKLMLHYAEQRFDLKSTQKVLKVGFQILKKIEGIFRFLV
jgi:hypothetical protein